MGYNSEQELEIIAQTRNEVLGRKDHTGVNLFLVWGYPTAFFLLVEFAALLLWNENWCSWLWVGIPLVGAPLMIYNLHKDYDRTGRCTKEQNLVLELWIFIGGACCIGGFTTGVAEVFNQCFCTIQGVLVGFGCFLTGSISHLRPVKICGIIGSILSFSCLFFQGDLWPWQLFMTAIFTIIALIIPGHLFRYYAKQNQH